MQIFTSSNTTTATAWEAVRIASDKYAGIDLDMGISFTTLQFHLQSLNSMPDTDY
jgi:hypothetical protein